MSTNNKMEIAFISEEIGIIETIIKKDGKTIFAVCRDGEIKYKKSITLPNGQTIIPLAGSSGVISSNTITLPPKPIEYESEKELFKEIRLFIGKYFITTKGFRNIAALYVMLTWVYERFNDLPYLRVIGTLGTGKSRFLKTLSACSYNSMMLGSASVAAMFRTIDKFRGTFVLDEANFKNSEFSSEVAKIFNNGNTKGTPVARMRERTNSKGEFTTDFFQVFGPKILASRESFNDTALESRCFSQRLYPDKNVKAPRSLDDSFFEEAKILRGKLLTFRFRNFGKLEIKELDSEKINNLRILQIAQPVWNIALLISKKVAQKVIDEALTMDQELISDQADTYEADILISIMKLMDNKGNKIHIKDISEKYFRVFGRGSLPIEVDNSITIYDYKSDLSARKVGEIIGKSLHIKKHRDNKGFYIIKDSSTKTILKGLCERHGITDDLIYP